MKVAVPLRIALSAGANERTPEATRLSFRTLTLTVLMGRPWKLS